MSHTVRAAILTGLCSVIMIGATVPALASYADRAAVATTIGTLTVQPPAEVSSAGSWCNNGVLSADFSWRPSPTAQVTGYIVRTFRADGTSTVFAETNAATTEVTGIYPSHGQAATVAITVTTRTSYGWTKESAQAQVPPC